MGVKVKIDGVYKKLSKENFDRGRYALANQAMADMNQYVPRKRGDLRQKVHASHENIIYESPYAKRQFYLNGRKYSTPGTGPRWDLKAKSIHGKSWKKAFVKGAGL